MKIVIIILSLLWISCTKRYVKSYPNVVVILTDDQGWGDISLNGNPIVKTPNIDALAKNGSIFENFYVCPVCSPTRAEFLTGRYHIRGGVFSTSGGGERLDYNEATIAEYFKRAGYLTACYGKWHNGQQPPYDPLSRGFDDFYGFCSGHLGTYYSPMLEHNNNIIQGNGYITDDITDHALDFIKCNKDVPFFLYIAYNTPHSPMQVPDIFWRKINHQEIPVSHRYSEKEDILHTKAALAMCENIDWNVGRLTQKIEELGISEKTIIVYFSDNGPNGWRWNGDMKGIKGETDEGGVRVPMFVKWKGVLQSGSIITEIACVLDVLPTLIDLTGIDFIPTNPLDGLSLKPLLLGKNRTWPDRIIVNTWAGKISLRNKNYRLDHMGQLFDMDKDKEQKINVANKNKELLLSMNKFKEKWIYEVMQKGPRKIKQPFTIGYNDSLITYIKAGEGIPYGNIMRSAVPRNSSFFTNWIDINDSITWDIEVLSEGDYEVDIFYTCPKNDTGATIKIDLNGQVLTSKIIEAYDSPILGIENDRVKRNESYTQNFKPINIGNMNLKKGKGKLTLKAIEIPGSRVMDFHMLAFKKI